MACITLILSLMPLVRLCLGHNPYPSVDWEAGTIDLGNGGDRTFYLLQKCQDCKDKSAAPLFMWLTGGPGGSSLAAQYFQNGAYLYNASYQLDPNPHAWSRHVDIMWVDNPVGVPFSLAKSPQTLCRNQTCVSRNLYAMLVKFMDLHPWYKGRPFYLVGESFAGHYIPYFSTYLINAKNPDINLVGLGVGNGVLNIYEQLPYYPDYLFMLGNITIFTYMKYKLQAMICIAARTFDVKVFDYFCNTLLYTIANELNLPDPTDITVLNESDPLVLKRFNDYVNSSEVKQALGTEGRNYFYWSTEANAAMRNDWSLALSGNLAYALDSGKKVVLWYGDKDYICNYLGGIYVVEHIPWTGKTGFGQEGLQKWNLADGKEVGMIRKYQNLKYIQVYNAGHSIFSRQPKAGVKLLEELLADK